MHRSWRPLTGALAVIATALGGGCGQVPTSPLLFGPPSALQLITGDGQEADLGQRLPVPLTVQVLDATGHPVPGVTVEWKVTPGDGTVLADTFPTVTDSIGLAVVFWQLGSPLGRQTVLAVSGSMEVTFTAQALLPLNQQVTIVSGGSQTDTVAGTLANPIVAQVLRADGTPDSGAVVSWSTQSGHFSPIVARADRLGHASTMWTLDTVAGVQTGSARARGRPPVDVAAQALPGAPVRLAISTRTLPLLGTFGDVFPVYGQAWDRYGNFVVYNLVLSSTDTTIAQINDRWVVARHHGSTWLLALIGTLRDSVPVTVLGFSAMTSSGFNLCGVSLPGDVYCWGANSYGSVGDGTTTDQNQPVQIGQGLALQLPYSGSATAQLADGLGGHTCALNASGQAYCWGIDEGGEVGDGSPEHLRQPLPVPVVGGHVFSTIRAGNAHTCAVTTSGDAYCWGNNTSGQLGRDTVTGTCAFLSGSNCSTAPLLVAGGLTFAQVSAGPFDHSCGVTTSGDAYCWGQDAYGQLGIAAAPDTCQTAVPCSRTPRLVQGGLVFKSVKAGYDYTCGVTVSGDGYCWGLGTSGQLGNGGFLSSATPVKVSGGLAFTDVQAGNGVACGLTTGGRVYCWGSGWFGATPGLVPWNVTFVSIAVDGNLSGGYVCALSSDNDAYCWGTGPYYPFAPTAGVGATARGLHH